MEKQTSEAGCVYLLSLYLSISSVQKIKTCMHTGGTCRCFCLPVGGGLPEEPPPRQGSAHWEHSGSIQMLEISRTASASGGPAFLHIFGSAFETGSSTFQRYLILREHAVNVLRGQILHQTMLPGESSCFVFF